MAAPPVSQHLYCFQITLWKFVAADCSHNVTRVDKLTT